MLERMFRLSARGTDARTETLAGLTTFLTMAYIIFVQPAVLSVDLVGKPTGMDFGGVLLATCLGSAFASILMGLLADYPIALAPGMGENFFFVTVVMGLGALTGAFLSIPAASRARQLTKMFAPVASRRKSRTSVKPMLSRIAMSFHQIIFQAACGSRSVFHILFLSRPQYPPPGHRRDLCKARSCRLR